MVDLAVPGPPGDREFAVRAPIVAELCRSALEAACHRVVWRIRVARAERHADIEAAIEQTSHRLTLAFALALFDDPDTRRPRRQPSSAACTPR